MLDELVLDAVVVEGVWEVVEVFLCVELGGVHVVVGVSVVCVVVGLSLPPLPNDHVPYSCPTDSLAKKSKSPVDKSSPP